MPPTTFLRLLPIPIDAKGDALAERIAALNAASASASAPPLLRGEGVGEGFSSSTPPPSPRSPARRLRIG
jgi:hypothetical protein